MENLIRNEFCFSQKYLKECSSCGSVYTGNYSEAKILSLPLTSTPLVSFEVRQYYYHWVSNRNSKISLGQKGSNFTPIRTVLRGSLQLFCPYMKSKFSVLVSIPPPCMILGKYEDLTSTDRATENQCWGDGVYRLPRHSKRYSCRM